MSPRKGLKTSEKKLLTEHFYAHPRSENTDELALVLGQKVRLLADVQGGKIRKIKSERLRNEQRSICRDRMVAVERKQNSELKEKINFSGKEKSTRKFFTLNLNWKGLQYKKGKPPLWLVLDFGIFWRYLDRKIRGFFRVSEVGIFATFSCRNWWTFVNKVAKKHNKPREEWSTAKGTAQEKNKRRLRDRNRTLKGKISGFNTCLSFQRSGRTKTMSGGTHPGYFTT